MADFSDSHPTIDWNPLGDVYYSYIELYDMLWNDAAKFRVDLAKFKVAAGAFGGPIALTKTDAYSGVQTIYTFTASGKLLKGFNWDGGRLIKMGFSVNEDLICVAEEGKAYTYDMFGNFKKQFALGMEVQKSKIIDCSIFASSYGTGICLLTDNYQFYVVNNIEEVKVNRLQCPNGVAIEAPPSCWIVLCLPEEQGSKVLMARDNNLFELDTFQAKPKTLPSKCLVASYIEMAVSLNGQHIAILADTGLIWIGSSNLKVMYCEYDTRNPMRPTQLVWCGSGAVVGYWENHLLMVGPTTETLKRYHLDSSSFLVQEIDGLRVIGNEKHHFLRKVPPEVEDVFKLGSMKPGAMLHDANREYESKRVRVDDYMRAIKNHLQEAVHECIKAAGHEFDQKKQRSLMKAASFGKSFLKDMRPQAFVDMCQTLRVLNNVRDYKVGIPLTYAQYPLRENLSVLLALQKLTLPVLIDRLVLRRQYPLAIKVCDYLKIPKRDGASRVLGHWACEKVQQIDIDDEQLAREIAAKLGDSPGISYTEIASNALDRGRTALAIKVFADYLTYCNLPPFFDDIQLKITTINGLIDGGTVKDFANELVGTVKFCYYSYESSTTSSHKEFLAEFFLGQLNDELLDYEPKAADQVPLLIRMKKHDLALQKAVNSGDTDLVYMVMDHIKDILTLGAFLMKIRTYPLALNLFIKRCKQKDRRLLVDIYYQEDQFRNSGDAFVQDSYAETTFESRIKLLCKAKESYDSKGSQLHSFGVQSTEEQIRLLNFQHNLESQYGKKFIDLPVNDTLYQLIFLGYLKYAEQMRKDFSIPDARYWWKKIQALGAAQNWQELEKFSKSKKSPIGYEPFVEVCINHGSSMSDIEKYMQRVPVDRRISLYIKMRQFEKAAETAFLARNIDELNSIQLKCQGNAALNEKIHTMKTQLSSKR
eukprot:gene3165-3634_t